jgi:hypothetical protein
MKHPEKNHGFLGGSFIFSGKTSESKSSQSWLIKKTLKEPAVFIKPQFKITSFWGSCLLLSIFLRSMFYIQAPILRFLRIMGTNPENHPDIRQGCIPVSNKLLDRGFLPSRTFACNPL